MPSEIAIFTADTREGTTVALEKMRTELEPDEVELLVLTESALEKLRTMTDADYEALDLMQDVFE